MTAASLPQQQEWPEWLIPPRGGFTADYFLKMQGLPRHTELIDGSLVFVSPQDQWHGSMTDLLRWELDRQAPSDLRAVREMAVRLSERQVPEPDVAVITEEALDRALDRTGPSTYYRGEDVVLAIEVVSPDSEIRDRDTKPRRYAAAGIHHFWRVEREDGQTVVYVYQRDLETGSFALTGIHHDRLVLPIPFPIDIDLAAVGRRQR